MRLPYHEDALEVARHHFPGHGLALGAVIVWAVTFVSTKVLLSYAAPIDILFARFIVGLIALVIFYPHRLKVRGFGEERWFIAAGATGVLLYYLLENIALIYISASLAGVVVATAPFFTGIACAIRYKKRLSITFILGFLVSIIGVAMVSFGGAQETQATLESTTLIDTLWGIGLALAAAATWALYSLITKKLASFNYHSIQATRRTFVWGIAFMIVILPFSGFTIAPQDLVLPEVWGNILFLGLGASALCFVSWNAAVRLLGPLRTSVYIYLVPALTILASTLLLGDPLTPLIIIGVLLTIAGLVLSTK